MGVKLRRIIGSIVFLIFGLVCVSTAFHLSENSDNKNYFVVCALLYSVLLLTIVRYRQYITGVQRGCSAVVIGTMYICFWLYTYKVYKEFHEKNIYSSDNDFLTIAICSGITGTSDLLVFSSYFYEDDTAVYRPVGDNEIPLTQTTEMTQVQV
jgi:Ca2+/Na+ antiporter